MTSSSKQRVSLRRKQKTRNDRNHITEISENDDDDDAFEFKSPSRQIATGDAAAVAGSSKMVNSPRFLSPVGTGSSSLSKPSPSCPRSADTSLDDSSETLGSQVPTPSKWNYLLPDFNSQPDGVDIDVLWDCASPDAVKYLRRVKKDNSNIKELIKFVKEPTEVRSKSPPLHLPLLRASLQKQLEKKKNPPDAEKRNQKKLARKRKEKEESKERERQLFGQILSAVAKREELEAKEKEEKQSEFPESESRTVAASTEEDGDDGDCWEDDDLFENNSFIIAATQNPHQFMKENKAKTSTPILAVQQRQKDCDSKCPGCGNCSVEDSQNLEVIPPTYVSQRLLRSDVKPRNLLSTFLSEANDTDETSDEATVDIPAVSNIKEIEHRSGHGTMADTVNQPCSSGSAKHPPAQPFLSVAGKAETNISSKNRVSTNLSSKNRVSTNLSSRESEGKTKDVCKSSSHAKLTRASCQSSKKRCDSSANRQSKTFSSYEMFSDNMSDDEVSDELFLKVSERGDVSESQVIQEYPTQARAKVSAHATLESTKQVITRPDDFPDDLDHEILASICEYDSSLCESPVVRKQQNDKCPGKPIASNDRTKDKNPGPSDNKLLKLQGGSKTTCVPVSTSNSAIIYHGQTHNQQVDPTVSTKGKHVSTASTKHKEVSSTAAQNKHAWPSLNRAVESSKLQRSGPATKSGFVFPPFAGKQQDTARPLSSLVMGSTVSKAPVQTGSKFTFKPLASVARSHAGRTPQSKFGATSTNNKPLASAGLNAAEGASLDVSCSQLKLDSAEELMDDDPLFESQIMAILDQVESQATQQPAAPTSCSQAATGTPPKYSQEEIEKKRQAAMQRRLRSKSRTKGKI